jgi:DNA polymerase III subunit gamma/tau
MGKALYRKYRSRSLDEVVGQKHVTDILSRSLKQGKIAHAYLLTGPKGVGKTSIARILAHEINQLPYSDDSTHLDIIEIDAASNNGVEDIRDLREKVNLAPVSAAKKVYIIDEVHMLSKAAFNALLKTLEEPPEHVVFILATTDVDKLPATIISRTQRFGFHAIGRADAVQHLKMIAGKEGITIDDEALALLADRGDGSFRDSISLLDQLSSLADETTGITPELVETTLGLAPHDAVTTLLAAVKNHDTEAIVKQLDIFDQSGIQPSVLVSQLVATIRVHIAEAPQLVNLLDALLEVNKSSHPSIKLLTVLLTFASVKPKTAALAAPSPVISKPIEELKTASKPPAKDGRDSRPTSINDTKSEVQPKVSPAAKPEETLERNGILNERGREVDQESRVASEHKRGASTKQSDEADKPINKGSTAELDWPSLIDYVRQNHVAIYSVLSKCTPEQSGDTLTLYTGTAFYKKKLDEPKYRPLLAESLIAIGAGELTIDTIPSPAPPKDEKAAAIAALMGGGEEVTIEA